MDFGMHDAPWMSQAWPGFFLRRMCMAWNYLFFINSAALGVGLAMDAFSVSLANGLNEPHMKKKRMSEIAGVFAFCQWIMPMIGWLAVHTVLQYFTAAEKAIPWIALALLGTIGGKMLYEGRRGCDQECAEKKVGRGTLIVQGIATSIDALSVGFTMASYDPLQAFVSSLIIAAVTFIICIGGLLIGRKFGMKLADKASILGGSILIAIGLEIFISNIF
jgi:putative Mn2+ efflux pump MntP